MTLVEQVASLRRTLHRLITRRLSKRTRRPFLQLLALKAISVEGVRTQAALADRLLVDAPATSRLVDRLEEEGLVRRCEGADRRCVRLEVTPAAQTELAVLIEETQSLDGELRQLLTASELRELKRLLDKVQEGLASSHAPADPEDASAD